jgi:AcrR family transcriptional regulator
MGIRTGGTRRADTVNPSGELLSFSHRHQDGRMDLTADTGLRSRKKAMTRQAILSAAEEMFNARGYDQVTVAEIADAANVSVKTLFTYFRSKEDLAFADADWLRDTLLDAIAKRAAGQSVLNAVADGLAALVNNPGGSADLESFHRAVGDSPALQGRLRRMWEEYEDAFTAAIAKEMGQAEPSPQARLIATILVALVRSMTSGELRVQARQGRSERARERLVLDWIRQAQSLLSDGLGDVLIRSR